MKTEIKILFKNIEKRVYQDIYSGILYIKHKGEKIDCEWLDDTTIKVKDNGLSLISEYKGIRKI